MSKKTNKQAAKVSNKEASILPTWMKPRIQQWIVFIFAFVLYSNTLVNSFTQDDAIVIQENMFTQEGIKGIPGILKYDTFYGFFKDPTKAKLVSGGRYRPFTLVTFAVIKEIFGEKPFIFHLFTILLFAFTCLVLYQVLLKLLITRFSDMQAGFIAFCAAILFVSHPIHTEVVANIKGADETFSLLGGLSGLWFCIKARNTGKLKYAWIGAICLFVGMMSKENAITYLAILPLSLWYFYKDDLKNIVRYSSPYLFATLGFLAIRTAVIGFDLGGSPGELMNNPFLKLSGTEYIPFTPGEKIATILYTLGLYIKLLILPHPLTHDYYPRHIAIMNFSDIAVLLSLAVYIALAVIAFRGIKNRSLVSFSIMYYLITLSIVSNLLFPIGTNMSERFLFMPSIGFCLLVAYGIVWIFNKAKTPINPGIYQKGIIVMLLICVAYSYKTFSRNLIWKDNFTLFTTDVKVSENSAKLQNSVGGELITKATRSKDENEKKQLVAEAIPHLQKALQIHPGYHNAYLLIGNGYFILNDYDNAIVNYNNVLKLYPDNKDAKKNIQMAYREGGKYYGEKVQNLEKAFEYLNKAYELDPNDYETIRLLGVANGVSGKINIALDYFKKASEIKPSADAFRNLSTAYYNAGDKINGDLYARKADEMPPAQSENSGK